MVVKKVLETNHEVPLTFNGTKNVKKFKKQAFAQNGNLVKSKPVIIDLTLLESGSGSRNNGTSSRNGKNGNFAELLSREDQASQIKFTENNAQNEEEEREVDAFWNFQASQGFSPSFSSGNKRRTIAR